VLLIGNLTLSNKIVQGPPLKFEVKVT